MYTQESKPNQSLPSQSKNKPYIIYIYIYIYMSPSVSVALRRIGAPHLKLTADMRPYSSLFLPCRIIYTLLSTIFHGANFVPIIPVES